MTFNDLINRHGSIKLACLTICVFKPHSLFLFVFLGYCGADIKAVCSEAALCALRRRYPQIYSSAQKLVLDVNSIAITNKDFMSAMSKMVPVSQRYNQITNMFSHNALVWIAYFSSVCSLKINIMRIVVLRAVVSPAKALIPAIRPLLSTSLQDVLHVVSKVFPHAEQGLRRKTKEGSVLSLEFVYIWIWHIINTFYNFIL